MPLVFDSTSSGSDGTQDTSQSLAHTCGTLYKGGLFAVIVLRGSSTPVNVSAAYAGVSMTKIGEASTNLENVTVALFYLLNPASGANSIAFTWTNNAYPIMAARSFAGVHQGIPILPGSYTSQASSASPSSINVASMPGDRVIDVIGFSTTGATTAAATYTEFLDLSQASAVHGGASIATGVAGTVAMSWALTGLRQVIHAGFCIHAALPGGGPVISPSMIF